MKKKPKKHCPTCHCAGQARAGSARMAKLSPDERSVLARKGGLAKAANQKARLKEISNLDSIVAELKAAGRKVTTTGLLRKHDEMMDRIIAKLRHPFVTDRAPKRRGEYGRRAQ